MTPDEIKPGVQLLNMWMFAPNQNGPVEMDNGKMAAPGRLIGTKFIELDDGSIHRIQLLFEDIVPE